jgi:hypothetical protein
MKSQYFWEKMTLKKFRIVFETEDFVHGRDANNQFCSFRKDTGLICFSEREILETRLAELEIEQEIETDEDETFDNLSGFGWQSCFGKGTKPAAC